MEMPRYLDGEGRQLYYAEVNKLYLDFTRVIDLFFLCRPLAILRCIVTVIVDTVNRVFLGRLFTHIFQKILKATFTNPSIAYSNTSTAISSIAPVSFTVAPSFHRSPRVILVPIFNITPMPIVGRTLSSLIIIPARHRAASSCYMRGRAVKPFLANNTAFIEQLHNLILQYRFISVKGSI